MMFHKIKLAMRAILSQKSQSLINILGVSIGLSCTILIVLYVNYEFSYDNFHNRPNSIYRVAHLNPGGFYRGSNLYVPTPPLLKEELAGNCPEVEYATKLSIETMVLESNQHIFRESRFMFADKDFFNVFSFPIIIGDPKTILKEPFTLLISRDMAKKYFGDENPVGKILRANNKNDYTVKGVFENIPQNSHITFDFISGFVTIYSLRGGRDRIERWNNFSYVSYVKLFEWAKAGDLTDDLESIVKTQLPEHRKDYTFFLQPLTRIHLGGNINFEISQNIDKKQLLFMISVAFFILLIAIFNYINLASARNFNRGKEIAVKKVSGGSKSDIIGQLVLESLLISMVSLIASLFLAWLLIPFFEEYVNRNLSLGMIFDSKNLPVIILITLVSGIISGLYPAFQLSSFKPVSLLNGTRMWRSGQSGKLRNILVIMQYSISVIALVSTIVIFKQLNYIRESNLGYRYEDIINIDVRDPSIRASNEHVKEQIIRNPSVSAVSVSANLPNTITSTYTAKYWEGMDTQDEIVFYRGEIDENFLDLYDIRITDGRNFTKGESDGTERYIINQSTAKALGWDNPIGKRLGFTEGQDPGLVIGVVEDFHFQTLRLKIEPVALNYYRPGQPKVSGRSLISVRVSPGNLSEVNMYIIDLFKELSPGYLNNTFFLADNIDAMYSDDAKLADIIMLATIIVIFLASIGLYGLSSYTTGSRNKEMVIRRIFGSSPAGIVKLYSLEFARWIIISLVVGWLAAYLIMERWLQNFIYHTDIDAFAFLFALLATILISAISVGYQVIKSAIVNPARVLRNA